MWATRSPTSRSRRTSGPCWLAQWLAEQNLRVTLISRGYGSDAEKPNDEALELEQRLPGVPHLLNPNRIKAARRAVEELESQIIVLDDAFC